MVKAVQYKEFGSSDVLKVIDNYELPARQEDEVGSSRIGHWQWHARAEAYE